MKYDIVPAFAARDDWEMSEYRKYGGKRYV